MAEIKYENLAPSAFDTSPKYDMKIFHDHFNLGGRIWGRKSGSPRAGMSALEGEIDELVYQLYGLTPEEIAIVEGKS